MIMFSQLQAMSYMRTEGLKMMSRIEDAWGNNAMFHEVYPSLYKEFWDKSELNDVRGLMFVYVRLTKMVDKAESEAGNE